MSKDDLRKQSEEIKSEENALKNERQNTDADRVQELRERLYARGSIQQNTERHSLPHAKPILRDALPKEEPVPIATAPTPPPVPEPIVAEEPIPSAVSYEYGMATARRKSIRKKLTIAGVVFFLLALTVSGFLFFVGNNTISGENISISVNGPIAVGGGDELSYQVSVANQNAVPIQSATLIIEYPRGTQNPADGKEMTVERKQLDVIDSGELVNVPLKARVYGEENEEKEVKVSIDYRVEGSNATFHKEATPLRFKISSSPVIITFDVLKTVSSGQEFELKLNVQSNSPTQLTDLLVKAVYPGGFDFSESDPETASGEDVWKITKLTPGEKRTISIRGLMTGYEDETRRFTAMVGVAHATDKNTLASTLSQAQTEVIIERPFLEVGVLVNGNKNNTVIVDTHDNAIVEVSFENTLDTTIYEGKVKVELSGNALNEFDVHTTDGFYDSTRNTVTWDSVDTKSLKEILPGQKNSLFLTLDPNDDVGQAPEMKLTVTVLGKRVFEDRVPEELVGTTERIVKLESIPTLASSAFYKTGVYTNTGPTPPIAEKVTQYTFALKARAGANDLTGAEVTAVLPQYMSWLDLTTDSSAVSYNPNTRTMKWIIGDMNANEEVAVSVQVSFLPSLTQVGTTPTILEAQRFKATDRFTGTTVRADHSALTTSLIDESDSSLRDGRVREDD